MKKNKRIEFAIRLALLVVVASILVYAYSSGAFQFILDNPGDLGYLAMQHIKLVALSSIAAIAVAVPLGILITRPKFKRFEFLVVNFANIGQTVPSIAILALFMSYMGLGWKTAIFALWLSSLLPILRNTIAGIQSVHPAILDAGKGMGMKQTQVLMKLELPNSAYAILAGIRTSTVINVGTAALAFLIGGGGLGDLIFTGISLYDTGIMLAGAVPVILMAVSLDFLIGGIEKVVTPKGLQRKIELT